MTVLYIITRWLTLPGAMVRSFWEHMICRIWLVPVEDGRILRRDELCSHMEHPLMPTAGGAFSIAFIPALLNGVLALLLFLSSYFGLFFFRMTGGVSFAVNALAYWFAFSLYVNSYPSLEDALNMKEKLRRSGSLLQKICFAPGAVGCYVGAYLERYCVTFLLAAAGLVLLMRFPLPVGAWLNALR